MKRFLFISTVLVALFILVGCGCTEKEHTHIYGEDYICQICDKKAAQSAGLDYELDPKENGYIVIGKGICDEKNVVIPLVHNELPVIGIKQNAFYNEDIESITISSSVKRIDDYALSNCVNLKEINVSEENKSFKSIDGSLYSKDGKRLIQYALGKGEEGFNVPDSVTEIGVCAFSNSPSLKSVVVGDNVKTIGASAFLNCIKLESVNLAKVEEVKEYSFYSCTALESIFIPDTVSVVGVWAFYGCTELKINCEADVQPEGWHVNWNESACPVVWEAKANK